MNEAAIEGESVASPNGPKRAKGHVMDAGSVYYGSNGGVSRSFCAKLEKKGHLGRIAAQLFRVQKASSRAKVYRGGIKRSGGLRQSFRDLAYQRKDECIKRLCDLLVADSCAMKWGWKVDVKQSFANNLLYVDLPNGQVSFHVINRYDHLRPPRSQVTENSIRSVGRQLTTATLMCNTSGFAREANRRLGSAVRITDLI